MAAGQPLEIRTDEDRVLRFTLPPCPDQRNKEYGCSGSAGAVLSCEDVAIAVAHDPNDVGVVDLTGLALVPTYSVLPHYDDAAAVTQPRPIVSGAVRRQRGR